MALFVSLVVALLYSQLPSLAMAASGSGPVQLDPHFYGKSCRQAKHIMASNVNPQMAAFLRQHFDDCFKAGCDASLLPDSSGSIESEKRSKSNTNKEIKAAWRQGTVSCADILALVARDSTVMEYQRPSSAPADDVLTRDNTSTSTRTTNSSLPLRPAGAARMTLSMSPSTQAPTPEPQPRNNAPKKLAKWLVPLTGALLAAAATLGVGGYVAYRIHNNQNCECFNNNNINCVCCCHSRRRRASV